MPAVCYLYPRRRFAIVTTNITPQNFTVPGIQNAPAKLNRDYQVFITNPFLDTPYLLIQPPFTMEMDITRNCIGSGNVCKIRFYNLDEYDRNRLVFNTYNFSNLYSIDVFAGYSPQGYVNRVFGEVPSSELTNVYSGNISSGFSVREGVNFITQLECYDAGYAFVNARCTLSFKQGTPLAQVIETIINTLPNVSIGAIGKSYAKQTLPKDNTYDGNPISILQELTGNGFSIDKGKAYALASTEYVQIANSQAHSGEAATLITDATGLLNTPVLEQTVVRFEMLFEPTLNVNQLVYVLSSTYPKLNNYYKITSVKHRGIISPVVSGELITIGEFFYANELIPVQPAT